MLQIVICQCSWKCKLLIVWSNNSIAMNILARVNKTKHKNKLGYYDSHFLKRISICMEYFFHPLTFSLYVSEVGLLFSSVQSLSRVLLFATPWTAARQASLSITNSWSLPKLMSIESVMPSNHLILCHPLLLLPSIFPSISQSVQLLSRVQLFVTPWTAARQASLTITNSWSSLRLMSIESVIPSSHLILCCPLFLLPPIPPSIRVFSNESTLRMRWPKYWSFSFSITPSKEHPGLIAFRMDWLDLLAVQGTLKSLLQYHVR